MGWAAIYDSASGRLLSVGDTVAEQLPAGARALALSGPPGDAEMWDEASRAFVARPAKVLIDRMQELLGDSEFVQVWASLNAAQRNRLRLLLIRLLGPHRYRNAADTLELR